MKIPEVEDGNTKGKGIKKDSVLNQNPLGAGLKDGQIIAFKFESPDEVEDMDSDWDVIMPSYEDESASQAQA